MQGRIRGKSRRRGRKILQREALLAARKRTAAWKLRENDFVSCLEVGVGQRWVVVSSSAEDQLFLG